MNLSRSSFYYTLGKKRPVKPNQGLKKAIEAICLEYPRYGYRRVTAQLHRPGWEVNHKKVLKIMRANDLLCRPRKRRWIRTTDSNHPFPLYPNLIKNCPLTTINQAWVSDITYIHLVSSFVFLAVIMDAYSRRIIGYALSPSLQARLTLEALEMALIQRNPPSGCIHHSDRGVQYASWEYVQKLKDHHLQISMSRKGNPYDNAMAESFMKTLKDEEVYLWEYRTIEDTQQRLPYFIEEVYNQKRLHSSLGYQPPNEFEAISNQTLNNLSPCPSL